jgi:RHS repeat-associated protein
MTASAVTYFDGRGKEFQQRIEVGPGRVTVSALRLKNPWGDVKVEYEPTEAATLAFSTPAVAGRPHRAVFFDGRARPVRTVDFNGSESRAEYRPFEAILHDANDTDASAEALPRGHFQTPRHEEFDVFRNRTRVVEEIGGGQTASISYTVSAAGDLLKITDAAGDLCTYTYDRMGRRLAAAHREAGQRKLYYDGRGKVVRALDAAGNDLRAELDPLGRLSRLTSGAVVLEDYTYDDAARNAIGRLASVTYRGGSQSYRYDAAGRTVEREYRFDGVAQVHTLRFEFDALGRETAVVHGDGTRFDYDLTANGLVRAIPGVLNEVSYDPRGLPVRITYANNVVTALTYSDGPARVTRQRTTGPGGVVLEDSTFTYDAMRMLLAQDDAAPAGQGARAFAYDPLYQLSRSTITEGGAPVVRDCHYTNHWNLDRLDEANRIFHYDDAAHPNRIAGLTEGAGPRANLAYDANGNLLNLPGRTFAYNDKNELDRVTAPGGLTTDYRYDHEGARVSKTATSAAGAVRTLFVGRRVEIRDGVVTHWVHLGEIRVAVLRAGTTRFVHSNYLGSTSFFTDAAGTKIASIAYRPFGNVASTSGVVDVRTYGAHPFDEESGLFYMRRRYYAPELGRFLTPDPLALFKPQRVLDRPRALHPYAYTGNDPVNNADPDGLSFWSVVGAIVGVIVGVALAALVVMTGGLAGILIGAGLLIGLMVVSYVVADATAGSAFGEFMRGFMIGVNAGLNAVFATMLFGPVIGIALGVINFLAAVDEVASNPIYQGILGWASWLMPMSWLATGVGLVVFVINLIVGFFAHTVPTWFGGTGWDQARINSVSIDWGTGTIVMHGGMFTIVRGGYNLGNFAYIHRDSAADASLVGHETGHALNVAAFGSIFHYIGAIDENVVGRGAGAYAEQLADSNDPTRVVADTTVWQEIWV